MCLRDRTISHLSSLSSDPLFSSILTFSALTLLYFPRLYFRIVCSPVILLTATLLLSLLRLGATQRFVRLRNQNDAIFTDSCTEEHIENKLEHETGTGNDDVEPETAAAVAEVKGCVIPCPRFEDTFVEWNVRAPLEVIYEEYEGEEFDHKDVSNENDLYTETVTRQVGIERYPSLSLYYPETTDSSSDSSDDELRTPGAWDSLDNMCFVWDEEEDKEELIEIALEFDYKSKKLASEFQLEEDNLIEIDISPMSFPTSNEEFSR